MRLSLSLSLRRRIWERTISETFLQMCIYILNIHLQRCTNPHICICIYMRYTSAKRHICTTHVHNYYSHICTITTHTHMHYTYACLLHEFNSDTTQSADTHLLQIQMCKLISPTHIPKHTHMCYTYACLLRA